MWHHAESYDPQNSRPVIFCTNCRSFFLFFFSIINLEYTIKQVRKKCCIHIFFFFYSPQVVLQNRTEKSVLQKTIIMNLASNENTSNWFEHCLKNLFLYFLFLKYFFLFFFYSKCYLKEQAWLWIFLETPVKVFHS